MGGENYVGEFLRARRQLVRPEEVAAFRAKLSPEAAEAMEAFVALPLGLRRAWLASPTSNGQSAEALSAPDLPEAPHR